MELAKSALFHRKDKSKGKSPDSPDSHSFKLMEENRLLDKSQEHIYTYDTDKYRKSVPNTPGRKNFKIVCIALGVIGLYLLGFSLLLSMRGGYSGKDLNDISSNCRYAMLILSIFVFFMAGTGYAGAYTNWKPIILTFSVLASMGFLGHLYVAKKLLDAVRFAERDLAVAWWDVYWDNTRRTIQDKYNCCGYRAYYDLPVVSEFCSLKDVYQVTLYDSKIKDPADVLKNDSYKKHFRGADSVLDDDGGDGGDGGAAGNAGNAGNANANAGNANAGGAVAGGAGDAGAGNANANANTNANANAGGGAAGGAGDAGAGNANANANANGNAGGGAAGNTGGAAKPGNANTNANAGGAAKAGNTKNTKGAAAGGAAGGLWQKRKEIVDKQYFVMKRQDTDALVPEPAIKNAPGCKEFLVPLVKGKLKLVYLFNYLLCLVYVGGIALSLIYWQNMRKEKEFDEFA
ncbi:hypothetical protein BCR32DRAFT_287872 [Anaeromyces robustus]|uniref:Uncharacterized protein n=1 Tax=Anaeromyces robustus TaxID=1754192 RepID=A0A1Y1VPR4_9FUNG|nr:hypothetical protein BCR32DRAFT_287872 [Anaeromyces robustus]|eukprot:ORX63298.1 hypothetical protein BCR32DRAFT_287872 [Anaeromyces robustus]